MATSEVPEDLLPDEYQGREQSLVKHRLLKNYLQALMMIIGQARYNKIAFIDCFAGPWQTQSESLSDTSVGIALHELEGARAALGRRFQRSVSVRALFIEKDKERFEHLQRHVKERPSKSVGAEAWCGEFADLQSEVLQWLDEDEFAFFFIDPTGWTPVSSAALAPVLARPSSEYLINFMYDFLNRFAAGHPTAKEILGFDTSELSTIADTKEREARVLRAYQEQVRQAAHLPKEQARTYAFDVKHPEQERTYFHLVYLTRHPKGICEFAKHSNALRTEQEQVRQEAKNRKRGGQRELFGLTDVQPSPLVSESTVIKTLTSRLQSDISLINEEWMADLLEDTGYMLSDIQKAFGELFQSGRAINIDARGRRRKHHVHHWRGERVTLTDAEK